MFNTEKLKENSANENLKDTSEQTGENTPGLLDKGGERLESIKNFVSSTKDKASGFFKSVGGKIGGMFNRGKEMIPSMNTVATVALSAPEIAIAGGRYVSNKLDQGAEKVMDGADKIGYKIGEGTEYVVGKVSEGANYVGGKIEKGAMNTSAFLETKAEQMAMFATEKANLVADATLYAKDKTVEGYQKVSNGIANRYNSVKDFAGKSIESAGNRISQMKENMRNKMNEARQMRLMREIANNNAKAMMHQKKAQDLQMLLNMAA